MSSNDWSPLGSVDPRELIDARLAVHYAAQPLAAAAYALLPMQSDHSHTNLLWSPEQKRFVGRPLPGGNRVFLDVAGFRTGVLDASGGEIAVVDPSGKTLGRVLAQMAEALRAAGEEVPDAGLVLPDYDLPAASVARGEPFPAREAAALEELERWFHDGFLVLSEVAERQLGGAEVRCWPHHFDVAALLPLDPDRDPEQARSVGVGFSPGDRSYAEPYFYVSPWPYPDASDLPRLPEGARWHTVGFIAAVLIGSEFVSTDGGEAQIQRVRGVLGSTVSACRALLEG